MDCEGYACKLFTKYDSTLMQQEPGVQGGGGGWKRGGGGAAKGRTQVQQSHVCIPVLNQWHKALLAHTCSHDES